MARTPILVLALAAMLFMAGCQGSGTRDGPRGNALPYSFQDGAIAGAVVDEQNVAVPDALIILRGTGHTTKSGPTGEFILRHVPPGTHTVAAQAKGFTASAIEVDVTVAALSNATITLTRLPDVEYFVDRARIDFTFGFLGGRMIADGLIYANVNDFSHALNQTPVAVVSTATWEQESPPGPRRMSLKLHMAGPPGNESVGVSPLTTRVELAEHEERSGFNVTFAPPPGCVFLGPCMLDEESVFVTQDVSATIVTAVFYKAAPPTDFLAEEPSG